jgi:putative spermidine/putrescine transport system permease protein
LSGTAGDDRDRLTTGWPVLDGLEHIRATLLAPLGPQARLWLMLAPAVLIVAALVWGLAVMADSSLRVLDHATFREAESWSLGNYLTALGQGAFRRIGWRTLWGSAVTTVVTLALAFPYAWVLVRTDRAWLRKALLVGLFLPFFIGQVVRAYGWLIVLGNQGLLNAVLQAIGLEPVRVIFTMTGVLVGMVQYMLPFAVLMLAPAITAIPQDVELASASLGARPWRTLVHVVLPMARPGLIAAAVVVLSLSLTEYAIPEIMGGGQLDFLASSVYDGFFAVSDAGLGSAQGIILTVAATLLIALLGGLAGRRRGRPETAP